MWPLLVAAFENKVNIQYGS